MKKPFFFLIGLYVAVTLLSHLHYALHGHFSSKAIEKAIEGQGKKVKIDSHFYFLSHGHQCYVFVSDDNQHVLKLFKKRFLKREWPWKLLPITPLSFHSGAEATKRRDRLFLGYKLAEDDLLIKHLEGTPEPLFVTLHDRYGFSYSLDLSTCAFVYQKKATPFRERFDKDLKAHDRISLEKDIKSLFTMLSKDYERGLIDNDFNIFDNIGFVGSSPMRIDFGRVREGHAEPFQMLKKIAYERIDPYVIRHYPFLREEVLSDLKTILSSFEQRGQRAETCPLAGQ